MRNSNRFSYYFSGSPSVIGSFFHKRTTDYNRFIREQKPSAQDNNGQVEGKNKQK